jgi:hypothetical protein
MHCSSSVLAGKSLWIHRQAAGVVTRTCIASGAESPGQIVQAGAVLI